jgi:hypothetical protein
VKQTYAGYEKLDVVLQLAPRSAAFRPALDGQLDKDALKVLRDCVLAFAEV